MKGLVLRFDGVSRRFGNTFALEGVSFEIREGENTVLLGPSGCGKSTALRLLAGLDAPSAGEIRFGDRLVSSEGHVLVPPHRRNLGMVFQDLALWPSLTALENVALGLGDRDRAMDALDLCGIAALGARKPHQLSGGQQQRVALARALARSPRFLLLDEPFTGLDRLTKLSLLEEIGRMASRQETTVILVTHDPLEARELCSRAVVLEGGRVAEAGALDVLLREGRSAILEAFRCCFRRL